MAKTCYTRVRLNVPKLAVHEDVTNLIAVHSSERVIDSIEKAQNQDSGL